MPRLPAALLVALSVAGCAHGHPRVVHESGSSFDRVVVTEEQPGLRTLRFEPGDTVQSQVRLGRPLDLQLDYTQAAMAALALVEAPKRILMVGLGGGAMPMFLRATHPDATIDVVEIDPNVIRVARRYFDFREDDRLRATAADGRAFVERSAGGYDLVFLDAYGPSEIPLHLATLEFLELVRDRLAPGGVVVGNVFGAAINPLFGPMHRTYAAAFDELCAINVPPSLNWIFLGRREGPASIDAELEAKGAGLTARFGLPFELRPYVERGCLPVEESGELLRDGARRP